jgi:hypothetical protein
MMGQSMMDVRLRQHVMAELADEMALGAVNPLWTQAVRGAIILIAVLPEDEGPEGAPPRLIAPARVGLY